MCWREWELGLLGDMRAWHTRERRGGFRSTEITIREAEKHTRACWGNMRNRSQHTHTALSAHRALLIIL